VCVNLRDRCRAVQLYTQFRLDLIRVLILLVTHVAGEEGVSQGDLLATLLMVLTVTVTVTVMGDGDGDGNGNGGGESYGDSVWVTILGSLSISGSR
jgi:hypothetical protein